MQSWLALAPWSQGQQYMLPAKMYDNTQEVLHTWEAHPRLCWPEFLLGFDHLLYMLLTCNLRFSETQKWYCLAQSLFPIINLIVRLSKGQNPQAKSLLLGSTFLEPRDDLHVVKEKDWSLFMSS